MPPALRDTRRMPDPDIRETWPAFLAALDGGDEDEIRAAFDRQQRAFRAAVLALDVESLRATSTRYELHNHSDFFDWRDVYRGVDGMTEWAARSPTPPVSSSSSWSASSAPATAWSRSGRCARRRASQIETVPWAQIWTLRGDDPPRRRLHRPRARARCG